LASKSEESKAFAKLRRFVSSALPTASVRWHDGSEPPDFDLFIDDVEYAVEVTELRKLYEVGAARLPFLVIGRELEAFVQRAERALVDAGGFNGEYAVVIPRPIPGLRTREHELIGLIGAGIEALHTAPPNAKVPFLRVDRRRCSLIKLAADGCRLVLYGPTDAPWGEDSRIEILPLLEQHIRTKAKKLRDITVPRLLVIDDKHLYSELEHFPQVVAKASECEAFHTIFIARGHRADVVLTPQFPGAVGVWDLSRAF